MSFDGQRPFGVRSRLTSARILLQILGIGAVAAIADRVVIYHQGAIAHQFWSDRSNIASEERKNLH